MRLDRLKPGEQGQTLVIFVFAAVGLLAMVGLAIDGGTVFLERRRMQNAADAGALAGVQKLAEIMCDATVSPADLDTAIWAEVEKYAGQNGVRADAGSTVAEYVRFDGGSDVVPFTPSVYVGNSLDGGEGVPTGASGISATATITHTTYFVSLIGIRTANASAPAIAVTGPPAASGDVRPIGVPLELVQDLGHGDSFQITFSGGQAGGETTWLTKTAQHRGWMNLMYVWNSDEADRNFPRALDDSAGAKEMKDWMEDGGEVELSADCTWFGEGCRRGDFIHAKPGVMDDAVCMAPGTAIVVPIYDHIPICENDVPDPKPACPTQGGGYVYHIVGFTSVIVTECQDDEKDTVYIKAEVQQLRVGIGELSWDAGYLQGICPVTTLKAITLRK